MILRPTFHFTSRRIKCSPLPTRVWTATRIALGVSVAICLTTWNSIHGDSEKEDTTTDSESPPASGPPPLAGLRFTDPTDQSLWRQRIRFFGPRDRKELKDGIINVYSLARFDAHIRSASNGIQSLISVLDGDLVNHVNIADTVQENLWFHVQALFRWYQLDHSDPHPVEHIDKPHPPAGAIRAVIEAAITYTDEFFLNHSLGRVFSSQSKTNAVDGIRATSASCLVSALYEADVRLLHVASLGNMRGILGRRRETEDGKVVYDVHVLTVDHTPENPAEKSRIEGLHAGEDVIENGELFGRPYTRALGDGKLKWSPEVQSRLHKDYLGAPPDPKIKTPPYISAQPDVNTIEILPNDFLVLSSRWLTECLTDEEVVGLVGAWLEKNRDGLYGEDEPEKPLPQTPEVILPEDLPVDLKQDKSVMYRRWNVPKRFINVDRTPVMHLATNAMGGADTGLREALTPLPPPQSEGNSKSLGIAVILFE
ncbi:phosphatase 2C-domain-containing protein [Mycena maculata]|uniref:Phosphatase 2C-domain-containing protein n=1 Tax=Mycena maculata TaxID=230809 RepID=A0AAD7HET5_9AGAR|nr:phosphatase 2C-domain-containing protein [Mycena maculata]